MRIDYTFEWVKYSSTSHSVTSPALTSDSIPFKPTFTQHTCRIKDLTDVTFVGYYMNIKLNPDSGDKTDFNSSSLITGVLI